MKATLIRKPLATAMLLALPLAAAVLAARPAHAQGLTVQAQVLAPAPAVAFAPRVEIERFVMRSHGHIRPGTEINYRVMGTPGARATIDVPGVVRGLEMTETRPGMYRASYTVRGRDEAHEFSRAIVTIEYRGIRQTARVHVANEHEFAWDRWQRRDDRAPQITQVSPSQGERVSDRGRVEVTARVSDEGSGVDEDTVVLRIDGREVSGRVRVENGEVRYRDDLRPGRHLAELIVRDRAGNSTRRSWSFDVVDHDRRYGWGYGR